MSETAHRDRLLIPALAPFYAAIEPYLYPFMRCVVGLMLVPHGIEQIMRGVPVWSANWPAKLGFWPPTMWGWAAVLTEVIGGVCIALGLFTRFFAAGAAIMLGVAAFGVHL
jgi:putative oxidoreductase